MERSPADVYAAQTRRSPACEAHVTVTCVDAARQKLAEDALGSADLIAFHLPMHTATRLAAPIIATARRLNRPARICAFGLYAPLNAAWREAPDPALSFNYLGTAMAILAIVAGVLILIGR